MILYGTILGGTLHYDTIPGGKIHYDTILGGTLLYGTIHYGICAQMSIKVHTSEVYNLSEHPQFGFHVRHQTPPNR